MTKQINITYDDKIYALEYNRKTVKAMEANGFSIGDIEGKPYTAITSLFSGAFLANHRGIQQSKVDEIYAAQKNKQELISKLVEMYTEPVTILFDEPEDNEGNAEWEPNW